MAKRTCCCRASMMFCREQRSPWASLHPQQNSIQIHRRTSAGNLPGNLKIRSFWAAIRQRPKNHGVQGLVAVLLRTVEYMSLQYFKIVRSSHKLHIFDNTDSTSLLVIMGMQETQRKRAAGNAALRNSATRQLQTIFCSFPHLLL